MKVFTSTFSKQALTRAGAVLLAFTMLVSCKKDDPYDFDGTYYAQVNFINASSDAGSASLFIDDVQRTPNAVAYGNASGYNKCYAGQQTATVQAGNNQTVVATSSVQLDANTNYTIFLAGQSGALSLIQVTDDMTAPSTGNAKVRFVNASSNASGASLTFGSTIIASNVNYTSGSAYSEIKAGSYAAVLVSGSTKVTNTAITLESGKIYTLYAKGVAGNTSSANALTIGIFQNK
ncbi:DUF4397 domain-containing protein [Mucilaginibacter robiniae]|uniref:DUF4397 domain-containing protein n=1 Tax=Mucilaginibacter robiniae TaxID=2728022 RepID=A0A7L5E829_9SPHI|nr:DUF4397 domain-containing protein [Mucilaginibacter robiniae]QJD97023.1 DUF4397 domain-containing protein [Mucilaginibacter robiniae]